MKPADFFFGVMEFFAILMPGALLVYLSLLAAPQVGTAALMPLGSSSEVVRWSAYGVASYVAGHLLHHVGSVLDDWYDKGFVRHKRRFGDESLLREARQLVRADLGEGLEEVSTFDWAGSWVRAHNDAAGAELEHSGADSKFFRSVCLVAVIAAAVFSVRGAVLPAIGSLALSWFSYRRFCKRRWDTTQLTYAYFVMLRRERESAPAESAAADTPTRPTAATMSP